MDRFARPRSPARLIGSWRLAGPAFTVETADQVVADRDGVCIVPAAAAPDVPLAAEAAMRKKDLVRSAILTGVDPQDAYLRHGKF